MTAETSLTNNAMSILMEYYVVSIKLTVSTLRKHQND